MIKRAIALLLSLSISLLPAVSYAGAGTKVEGYYKSLLPPLPKPKPSGTAAAQPQINLTVVPKKTQATPALAASSAQKTAAALLSPSAPPAVTPDELPQGPSIVQGISSITTVPDKMTVTQNASRAIINWLKFNIGSKAEVDFSQPSSTSVCLNRIFDQNPSQIFGKLNANGEIFLINQNGILFGQGSQVNLHTLIASSLNIHDNDFLAGNLHFQAEDYQFTGLTTYLNSSVINQGTITTDNLGAVFLLGPNVTNDTTGTIQTQTGQIGLAAGSGVSLAYDTNINSTRTALVVTLTQAPGQAINNGVMYTNTGLIGMYGQDVYQYGTINAETALMKNGQIELLASDAVYTSSTSVTESLISNSTETADQSFAVTPGQITITGLSASQPVSLIDLGGSIIASGGDVTLNAGRRVFMDTGSSIDVSGVWVSESASDNVFKLQMNSNELRDEPIQKNGILKGQWITINPLLGSNIGDISGALTTQQETVQQFNVAGGNITLQSQGDVIVKKGATINFSGGGTKYSAGNVTTTALVSGNKIYDIANAQDNLNYNFITTITKYMDSYVVGANAGQANIMGRIMVLDGTIEGSATPGTYQTQATESYNSMGNQKTLGLAEPVGGTLTIGNSQALGNPVATRDFMLDSVLLTKDVTPLPPSFEAWQPYEPGTAGLTVLSTDTLNAAGLSHLGIYCNSVLTTDASAQISLVPAGIVLPNNVLTTPDSFTAVARSIKHNGAIYAPGGVVSLSLVDNTTTATNTSITSQIVLSAGSSISVAGQRIDNSQQSAGVEVNNDFSHIAGGSVSLLDETLSGEGVAVQSGAVIDVSGGYGIAQNGNITGGNAGSLSILGANIILMGNLTGYSLLGNTGGSIQLTAQTIEVTPTPKNPAGGGLILQANQLDGQGFTTIDLEAANGLVFDQGAVLSPSLVKLATPIPHIASAGNGLVTVTEDLVGKSKIIANVGASIPSVIPGSAQSLTVEPGASVNVYPGGTISMSALDIDIGGTISALAGSITLTAALNLTVEDNANIIATGYNKPQIQPVAPGFPSGYTPMNGGSVSLTGSQILLNSGSTINVSGSDQIITYILNSSGVPTPTNAASAPGTISIVSLSEPMIKGSLIGLANMAGLQGGTLSIASYGQDLTISGQDLGNYISNGFDDITLKSVIALDFSGAMNCTIGRRLVLDAPGIAWTGGTGSGVASQVNLNSTYIVLQNSSGSSGTSTPVNGPGILNLSGNWIDINGGILLNGFGKVSLEAVHDIRLGSTNQTSGINVPGDLLLQADRIYPTMGSTNSGSVFTIESAGAVTIEGSGYHNSSPVYSAGSTLTIQAQNIDVEGGYLEAPMGQIYLEANSVSGSVIVAAGSTISTAGSIPISYGVVNNTFWTVGGLTSLVTGAPQNSVTITGNKVVTNPNANIDVSGGGSIFGYQFQPGIQGSIDPLSTTGINQLGHVLWQGRYVIVPSGDYSIPGQAVYLEGCSGLKAGMYSILPEQYAFLPGAMVITNTGTTVVSGTQLVSSDGFPLVAGFLTYMGTSVRPPLMQAFEVQPASYFLKQGGYNIMGLVAGNGGNVTLTGNTTVVDANISASALSGTATVVVGGITLAGASSYTGGTISLSGTSAEIGASTTPVNPDIPLFVSAGVLNGFNQIDVGANTGSLTIDPGAGLKATEVNLSAPNGGIIFAPGTSQAQTQITANSVVLSAGWLDMEPNSLINASNQVSMQLGHMGRVASGVFQNGFWGSVQIGSGGTLSLAGQNIYFLPRDGSPQSNPGLYVPYAFWQQFGSSNPSTQPKATFDNVSLFAAGTATDGSAQGAVGFYGAMNLAANDSFTINAQEIEGSLTGSGDQVIITAPAINLYNRGGWNLQAGTLPSPGSQPAGSLTLNATSYITVGEGPLFKASSNGMLIDGFSSVNFNAQNDFTFQGAGFLVAAGDLHFSSARVTTSPYIPNPIADPNTPYTAVNFTLSTSGNVSIASNGVAPSQTVIPGGTLEIDANNIDLSGVIQMASGTLKLNGTNGVTVDNLSGTAAKVLDTGYVWELNGQTVYTQAGSVYLSSLNGPVIIGNGVVDVSGAVADNYAYAHQDPKHVITHNFYTNAPSDPALLNAGLISIYSPTIGPVISAGSLTGKPGYWNSWDGQSVTNGLLGGSFVLDAHDLNNDFSSLYATLSNGGFNNDLDIRSRQDGSLTIASTDNVNARQFTLTADSGSIDVKGNITTSDPSGDASVQLYAGQNLTIESGSTISATGQGNANGGQIIFSSTNGAIILQQGSSLDVSAGGTGQGGTVHFRASWASFSSGQDSLGGAVTGANQILAEGVLYANPNAASNYGVSAQQYTYGAYSIQGADISNWQKGVQGFMNSAPSQGLFANLTYGSASAKFVPGLEIDSSGSLTLSSPWDLTTWKSTPIGFLTLRAGGDLNISANLTDAPNGVLIRPPSTASWGLNLVAGADLNSSNTMATVKGAGDFTISDGMMVYTQNAPVSFASGGDTYIGNGTFGRMINATILYTLGSYSGTVQGDVEGNLTINGGAIQTATGNIDINVGGSLFLDSAYYLGNNFSGTIRTTGSPAAGTDFTSYWLYGNGGNISLKVCGSVLEQPLQFNAWDTFNDVGTTWSAYYTTNGNGYQATEGLATMGGGNLTVHAGGDFLAQIGTFGYQQSNLTIFAGGNMSGRFLVRNGLAQLSAMGNFGDSDSLIEAAPAFPDSFNSASGPDVHIYVTALGSLVLPTVVNPTLAENIDGNEIDNLGYSQTSSVSLTAVTGDVVIVGEVPMDYSSYMGTVGHNILPATLYVNAGRDILIEGDILLAPYARGTLTLLAGRDINGENVAGSSLNSHILVSDLDPAQAYGYSGGMLTSPYDHDPNVLHLNDQTGPIIIDAGRDLENLSMVFPKEAEISAGRDIVNIYYLGQNLTSNDLTRIKAGGNITLNSAPGNISAESGIQISGPGQLIVQAGENINLGATNGIQSLGDSSNPGLVALTQEAASVIVIAGFTKDISLDDAYDFFNQLRSAGAQYSELMARGDTADAQQLVNTTRTGLIQPFINGSATQGSGDIDMTTSQICTAAGPIASFTFSSTAARDAFFTSNPNKLTQNIYVLAGTPNGTDLMKWTGTAWVDVPEGVFIIANGSVNVGQTAFITDVQRSSTGIYTGFGGAVNIFSENNVNVNESRIMTYMGGDITAWSDYGNINAGIGSKTVISASPPSLELENGVPMLVFHPPGEGSGIRAFTYYPEGVTGPDPEPPEGDIYLFAPQGVINAGEAGIAGRNVTLGAVQVLNANNIVFTAGSVGVPVASQGFTGLSVLTGVGSVAQAMQVQEAAVMSAAGNKLAQAMAATSDAFMAASLEVRVLSVFNVLDDSGWENSDN